MVSSGDEDPLWQIVGENAEGRSQARAIKNAVGWFLLEPLANHWFLTIGI